MATTDPPHLRWSLDEHYRGQTIRVAFQLAGIDHTTVTDVRFSLEQEEATAPVRVTVSLVPTGVSLGQSGVQYVADPTTLLPPLPAGVPTWEAVVESAALSMPAGWWRYDVWIDWPFGTIPVAAGRLHLREPAIS